MTNRQNPKRNTANRKKRIHELVELAGVNYEEYWVHQKQAIVWCNREIWMKSTLIPIMQNG